MNDLNITIMSDDEYTGTVEYYVGHGETYEEAEANARPIGETKIDGLHSLLLILVIGLITILVFSVTNKKE